MGCYIYCLTVHAPQMYHVIYCQSINVNTALVSHAKNYTDNPPIMSCFVV